MLRRALLVTPILLLGCASATRNPVIAGDTATVTAGEAPPVDSLTDLEAATGNLTDLAPDLAPDSQASPGTSPATPPRRPRQRFSLKGGYYGSTDKGIDDGYIINLAWKRPTSDILSSEVEIGYLDANGTDNGVDRDLWAIPLMVNGRFDVPLGKKLEIYGGLGLGSFYYNVEAKSTLASVSADGFLVAGDAYFGGGIHLGENFVLGLEGKYYVTDSTSDLNGGLDAYVVLLTLGFER